MGNIQIQFAEALHADQIADLFYSGFRPEVGQLLIYGSKGAPEHIRMQLAFGVSNMESVYVVARVSDGIIGALELRRQPDRLFLNYIAVHPGHRGQRVATKLLTAAVRMSDVNSGKFALDVLCDNTPALEWYRRLGFATTTSAEFLEVAPPGGADETPVYVSGLPQADLCQERFGFSRFNLISARGTFSVGRIGDKWFRLTDLAAVNSPAVFAALNKLDSRRRVFAVVPASSTASAQVVCLLARTHRMEMEIPDLMASLSNDY